MDERDRVKEISERYKRRMNAAREDAEKAFNKSMAELDRIGNDMYEEMRTTLKDGGIDIERMQVKLKEELKRDRDEIAKDLWKVESRLVRFGEEIENELRKRTK